MQPDERQSYSEQDAEEILRIASRLSTNGPEVSRHRLLETAAELGIAPEAIEAAERQFAEDKLERADRLEYLNLAKTAYLSHLSSFVIVNLFLIGLNTKSPL